MATPCARTASAPATAGAARRPRPPAVETLSSDDVHDVLAPGGGGTGTEGAQLVSAAEQIADGLLFPVAEPTDRSAVVPRSHLDALARAGLFGLFRPPGVPGAAVRRIFEHLAGGCGVTFFVWVQHHAPVRMLARSPNQALRARYLDDLCDGRLLGGVAFAYLRRPGPPAVVARRVDGGYVVDGEAPWVTSWGLADVYAVAARLGDDVVFFLVDGSNPALEASDPLALLAMSASSTVRLVFDGLEVRDGDVLSVAPFRRWQDEDRRATAQPNPAAFGIAARCVRILDLEDAAALGQEVDALRERSYALADAEVPDVDTLVEARAQSLELAVRAATALVVSVGGRAMAVNHPAQRLLREAAFFTIQAQTQALRRATLAQLAPRS